MSRAHRYAVFRRNFRDDYGLDWLLVLVQPIECGLGLFLNRVGRGAPTLWGWPVSG